MKNADNLPEIPFSRNWNQKLSCDVFTTIRIKNSKYAIGQHYTIMLGGKRQFVAQCVHIEYYGLSQLPERVCWLDTGYGAKEVREILINMYKAHGNPNLYTYAVVYLKKMAGTESAGTHQE